MFVYCQDKSIIHICGIVGKGIVYFETKCILCMLWDCLLQP